ncbi:hypothetical protein EDB98_107188 [Pseudomonas fluorescens]|nr:hypothetical protein EDB98_107188 [Pseudomonas fluorescens]
MTSTSCTSSLEQCISDLRRENNLSPSSLGRRISKPAGFISLIEAGLAKPTLQELVSLSGMFSVGSVAFFKIDAPSVCLGS